MLCRSSATLRKIAGKDSPFLDVIRWSPQTPFCRRIVVVNPLRVRAFFPHLRYYRRPMRQSLRLVSGGLDRSATCLCSNLVIPLSLQNSPPRPLLRVYLHWLRPPTGAVLIPLIDALHALSVRTTMLRRNTTYPLDQSQLRGLQCGELFSQSRHSFHDDLCSDFLLVNLESGQRRRKKGSMCIRQGEAGEFWCFHVGRT